MVEETTAGCETTGNAGGNDGGTQMEWWKRKDRETEGQRRHHALGSGLVGPVLASFPELDPKRDLVADLVFWSRSELGEQRHQSAQAKVRSAAEGTLQKHTNKHV